MLTRTSSQRATAMATRRLHSMAQRTASVQITTAACSAPNSRARVGKMLNLPSASIAQATTLICPSSTPARPMTTHAHHAAPQEPLVLVVGGNGALGQAMIKTFKGAGWKTICMDYKANPASDINITLTSGQSWLDNIAFAEKKLHEVARARGDKGRTKHSISVMVHCAGSWLGGGAESLLSTLDPMLDINLKSAVSTAHLASRFLDEQGAGLLLLTGAAAAANATPTPGMLSYGMSKAATHQLAISLAHKEAGLKHATVACLLPTMIDTPSNRAMSSNPDDYLNWTPPSEFATLALAFAQQLQPEEGASAAAGAATGGKTHAHTHHRKPLVEHAHAPLQTGGFYLFNTARGKTNIQLLPPVYVPEQA